MNVECHVQEDLLLKFTYDTHRVWLNLVAAGLAFISTESNTSDFVDRDTVGHGD